MSRSTLNRTVLATTGLLLAVGGALVLFGGLDLYSRLHLHPPTWWPLTSPHQPVVSTTSRTRWADRSWWWPAVIAALSLTVLAAAAWLAGQLRRSGPGTVHLPELRVRSRALEDVIETRTIELPEVSRVRTRLTGTPHSLRLHTTLHLHPDAAPAPALAAYRDGPLSDARTTLGRPDLESVIRLHLAGARRPTHSRRHLD
ncbi:alkaline shock response membrane anchor protein AmaP [Kitasatospora sp. NPDC002227]|uniref:alkaline shock response membrane anchor protein AmaP n=1 Tax=Kitasatospora sp. NPDC002227 TaxID=3154773 RepID=UPI00331E9959